MGLRFPREGPALDAFGLVASACGELLDALMRKLQEGGEIASPEPHATKKRADGSFRRPLDSRGRSLQRGKSRFALVDRLPGLATEMDVVHELDRGGPLRDCP